jgi:phage head maturation protease
VLEERRLFHVSLVDEPAYQEARVLAVRAAEDALASEIAGLLQRDWSNVWR